jgi:hypothetical protein
MIKTFSQLTALRAPWLVAFALASGCAAEHPQVAATPKSSVTGDNQVTCNTAPLTGSLIPTQVCTSKDENDRGVRNIEDQVAVAHGTTSAPR